VLRDPGSPNGSGRTFDTKIAVVVRDDLAVWQKLKAAAFPTSGVTAQSPTIVGEGYRDAAGNL
jgi:hypothetical protein